MPRRRELLNQIARAVESPSFNKTPGVASSIQLGRLGRGNQLAKVCCVLRAAPIVACQGLERHEVMKASDGDEDLWEDFQEIGFRADLGLNP